MNLKNRNLIISIFIILIAVICRILFIDKTGGLWYDEIVSFKEASQSNIFNVITYTLKTDVHLPIYPVLLHFWAKLFSLSDISLRLFSAFFGILTVIIAYFTGKELKSEKTGLFCAGVFSVNSFLIYYSQEVRLYSLLIFFTTLLTYFGLKFHNIQYKNSLPVIVGLAITSWLIVNTYTIAFLYVIPVFGILYYCQLFKEEKSYFRMLNYSLILFVILSIPTLIYMFSHYENYTNQINGYYCDWSSLVVVIQDWFSPVLNGLLNNPANYVDYLFNNLTLETLIYIILPVLISVFVICYILKKNKQARFILIPSLLFLLAEILAFEFTNFKILPRYVAIAVPNVLLILGVGLSELPKFKKLNIIIPGLLILINCSYLIFSANSAFKLPRNGFRAVSELINEQRLNSGDYIVVWNRREILDKYVNTNKLQILSLLVDFAYKSEKILGHELELNKLSLEERKVILRSYFADLRPPKNNISLMIFILNRMKSGQKFVITSNKYFDKFSPQIFVDTVNDDKKYSEISYNDLLTIKSLIIIKEICAYNLKFIGRFERDGNVIFVFEK